MIKIKLRRVKNNGVCLGQDCESYRFGQVCDELFVIGIEAQTQVSEYLLSLECVCRDCALKFADDLRKQCAQLGKRILNGDYDVEEQDVYEPTLLSRENEVKAVVEDALKPMLEIYVSGESDEINGMPRIGVTKSEILEVDNMPRISVTKTENNFDDEQDFEPDFASDFEDCEPDFGDDFDVPEQDFDIDFYDNFDE